MKELYPGHAEAVERWNVIRAKCCLPGWLDHIKIQPDPRDAVIEKLRLEIDSLRDEIQKMASQPDKPKSEALIRWSQFIGNERPCHITLPEGTWSVEGMEPSGVVTVPAG